MGNMQRGRGVFFFSCLKMIKGVVFEYNSLKHYKPRKIFEKKENFDFSSTPNVKGAVNK